jgi:hypothetical protein
MQRWEMLGVDYGESLCDEVKFGLRLMGRTNNALEASGTTSADLCYQSILVQGLLID